jgi:hypothetical protein
VMKDFRVRFPGTHLDRGIGCLGKAQSASLSFMVSS